MRDAQQIAGRVRMMRAQNAARDIQYSKVIAIRKGDYDAVAPGLFDTSTFDRPLVANLIDTTARDIAEVMAPLPSFNCQSASLSSEADQKRQDKRAAIANSYVQVSRLQDQMFEGTDRYGSFGFMAYIVEPDFVAQSPVIRVGSVPTAGYVRDWRGRTKEYYELYRTTATQLAADFPDAEPALRAKFPDMYDHERSVEVAKWYDDHCTTLVCLDPNITLAYTENRVGECLVRIIERPNVTSETRGQFDDVIWVQIARALVQMYTMNALEQSVNAPIAVPPDVSEMEIGPLTVLQSDNPQNIGRINLGITPQLFPEQQILAQEQRTGSRYPEGRSGSIDASIVTGQGVQALMGTFDTQVQTFQRLNVSALEDVIRMCFRMDEVYWGEVKKSRVIKDNGASRKLEYVPLKDIDGDYTVDVTYGAIAGLDPNRGLVFVLQALAGGLISKSTARKSLPVDMNPVAEERQIDLEGVDASIAASIAQLPLAIPQMAMGGMDPRELVLQVAEVRKLLSKGKSPAEAIETVFAPKETAPPEAPPVDPMQQAMEQAAAGGAPMPGQGSGGASDLLMLMSGTSPSGEADLSAGVSRYQPI